MVDPRRSVPGRVHVPLHVGVVGKELAFAIDRGVVLVAESRGQDLPGLALGIDLGDVPKRGLGPFHEVLQGGKQLVLRPNFRNPRMGVVLGQLGLVAHHDVEVLAVWGREDGVGAMLASGRRQFLDRDDFLEVVVTVFVEQTEYPCPSYAGTGVHYYVETVEGIAQALRMPDLGKLLLGFRRVR